MRTARRLRLESSGQVAVLEAAAARWLQTFPHRNASA
jgi:hypothetical protein